jgi:hypothetical protein
LSAAPVDSLPFHSLHTSPPPNAQRKPYIQNLHRSRWESLQVVKRPWTACLYIDHAHLTPSASPLPPTNPPCPSLPAIGCAHPSAGGTARRVHRPHTSAAHTRVTVCRSTIDARSPLTSQPFPTLRDDLSHRREREPRTSRVPCVTPAAAPSDGSQRTLYTSQQLRERGRAEGLRARCLRLLRCGLEVGVCHIVY